MAMTRVYRGTGLKSTDLVELLNVVGRGALTSIMFNDVDDHAGVDFIKIVIDGVTVLADTNGYNFTAANNIMGLQESIVTNTPAVTTDEAAKNLQRIPYHRSLIISYKRTTAGATGASISILYEIKG